jgi:hypothetical protein
MSSMIFRLASSDSRTRKLKTQLESGVRALTDWPGLSRVANVKFRVADRPSGIAAGEVR